MRLELVVANFEQTTSNPCTFQCSWSDFFSIQNSLFSHFWYQNVSHERNLAHVRPFIKHKICRLHKILYCLIDFSFFCSAGWCKDCSEPSTHLLFSSDCYFEFGTLAKLEVPVCLRAALEGARMQQKILEVWNSRSHTLLPNFGTKTYQLWAQGRIIETFRTTLSTRGDQRDGLIFRHNRSWQPIRGYLCILQTIFYAVASNVATKVSRLSAAQRLTLFFFVTYFQPEPRPIRNN